VEGWPNWLSAKRTVVDVSLLPPDSETLMMFDRYLERRKAGRGRDRAVGSWGRLLSLAGPSGRSYVRMQLVGTMCEGPGGGSLEEDEFDGRRFLQRTAGNGCNEPTGHRYAARFSVERRRCRIARSHRWRDGSWVSALETTLPLPARGRSSERAGEGATHAAQRQFRKPYDM